MSWIAPCQEGALVADRLLLQHSHGSAILARPGGFRHLNSNPMMPCFNLPMLRSLMGGQWSGHCMHAPIRPAMSECLAGSCSLLPALAGPSHVVCAWHEQVGQMMPLHVDGCLLWHPDWKPIHGWVIPHWPFERSYTPCCWLGSCSCIRGCHERVMSPMHPCSAMLPRSLI